MVSRNFQRNVPKARRAVICAATVVASMGHGTPVRGQGRREAVPDAPACPNCTIVATPLVSLGTRSERSEVRVVDHVIRNSRGQYIVGPAVSGALRVFDAKGKFVRQIGRAGHGPGEAD